MTDTILVFIIVLLVLKQLIIEVLRINELQKILSKVVSEQNKENNENSEGNTSKNNNEFNKSRIIYENENKNGINNEHGIRKRTNWKLDSNNLEGIGNSLNFLDDGKDIGANGINHRCEEIHLNQGGNIYGGNYGISGRNGNGLNFGRDELDLFGDHQIERELNNTRQTVTFVPEQRTQTGADPTPGSRGRKPRRNKRRLSDRFRGQRNESRSALNHLDF